MSWWLDFYNEGRGIIARYRVEAALPGEAARLGREAALAEYPPARARRRRLTLFERAGRGADRDGSGWLLYRITRDAGPSPLT